MFTKPPPPAVFFNVKPPPCGVSWRTNACCAASLRLLKALDELAVTAEYASTAESALASRVWMTLSPPDSDWTVAPAAA